MRVATAALLHSWVSQSVDCRQSRRAHLGVGSATGAGAGAGAATGGGVGAAGAAASGGCTQAHREPDSTPE
jgi:hypothetical protein